MENNKPFTTLNHPLILEHMKKVIELEGVLIGQEGFNPAMILEYHLQLAALALAASSEYNPNIIPFMFNSACEQLREMCHEEMLNQPSNVASGGSNTVN